MNVIRIMAQRKIPTWGSLEKKSKFKQRLLRVEKVSAKTLETWIRHRSENTESGRILDNSKNSSRYLNFTEVVRGGYPPRTGLSEAQD